MADASDAKPTPSATQDAAAGLRPAEHETNLVQNPVGDASLEAPATGSTENKSTTYTEAATTAASNAAATASTAASNVKDSVFSMFGGGAKKERKVEDDDGKDEPSGSSKAQKKDDDDDVRYKQIESQDAGQADYLCPNRTKPMRKRLMSSSSPWSA
jgi:hypothetical protein